MEVSRAGDRHAPISFRKRTLVAAGRSSWEGWKQRQGYKCGGGRPSLRTATESLFGPCSKKAGTRSGSCDWGGSDSSGRMVGFGGMGG